LCSTNFVEGYKDHGLDENLLTDEKKRKEKHDDQKKCVRDLEQHVSMRIKK
jgi:hypothetical protein